nr:MAG TPA: hypothetical protein [Caudoviricetes sp.]
MNSLYTLNISYSNYDLFFVNSDHLFRYFNCPVSLIFF